MTSTELKDNGLPWKMVAKGSRSTTRRTKKQAAQRPASSDIEAQYKSEGDSESEKQLGQHLAERVEHVPIKKRKFMVPAPSPLKRSSPRGQRCAEINHALPVSRLNPNLMGGKTAEVSTDGKPDCGSHDFSGIEILAEVACSSGMSTDLVSVVVDQSLERVQQQDALTVSTHVEGNDSSSGVVDVFGKHTTTESSDKVGEGKSEIVVPQKVLVSTLSKASDGDPSEDYGMVASTSMIVAKNTSITVSDESSTERPKENMEAGDSGSLPSQGDDTVIVSEKSSDERTGKGKNSECLTDDRLHWDLNLPTDAWGQPCDAVDEVSRRYSDGEVTESVTGARHVDGSKDYAASLVASDVHMDSSLPPGPKAESSARNDKESQSGYDSQFEDGELREPYPWEENESDIGDVEQVDYGSEPENELAESNENKPEDVEKAILAETKCGAANVHDEATGSDIEKHVVVCMNGSHSKGSSPSRSFGSKSLRASHETIPRRRPGSYEDFGERDAGPNKFVERDRTEMRMRSRSPGKGQFGGWDSRRRFSPPVYKGGQYGFGRPRPREDRVMMSGFDQPGPSPHGYVRRQFPNGGYRGRFRRFPDGNGNLDVRGDGNGNPRDFRSDYNGNRNFRGVERSFPPGAANDYPSRMHNNRMSVRRERSNSPPVFRRLRDPQSRSRSRSRSPVSWNERNRSPPPGFRAEGNRMERVRMPFQKRFPVDEEMGFMSQQRNQQRNSRFFDSRNNDGGGENHMRGRRSPPGRMFRHEQRFDNMRRVNSESNNFRPFVRHNNYNNRRFGDGGGGRGGGGCKYEGSEEEKNGNRYEMVHRPPPPPLRLEAKEEDGDNIRRFRIEAEQEQTVVSNVNNNTEATLTNNM